MFRFTIRDVLWLMVVVGLGVGWWLSSRKTVLENQFLYARHAQQRLELETYDYLILDMKNRVDAESSLKDLAKARRALRAPGSN